MDIRLKQVATYGRRTAIWVCALGWLLVLASMPSRAAIINIAFEIPDGFDLSLNGAPAAPSGRVTALAVMDNTTPNVTTRGPGTGMFAIDELFLTIENFGIFGELIIPALGPQTLLAYEHGFSLLLGPLFHEIGWNGAPAAADLMSDPTDLTTLPTGSMSVFTSSFFSGDLLLESGSEVIGSVSRLGPNGIFSVHPGTAEAPLPGTQTLLVLALGLLMGARWQRHSE